MRRSSLMLIVLNPGGTRGVVVGMLKPPDAARLSPIPRRRQRAGHEAALRPSWRARTAT
jgi:hypothetical protein